MKKKILSLIFAMCFIMPCMMFLTACGGTKYTGLNVDCTQNLVFLVGEDYSDSQIKALATLSDGSTEDVTNKITINTDNYNKNVAGKYKIYFEFEEFSSNTEVSVVDKITTTTEINKRFSSVVKNSFGDGAYSFEMTFTGKYNETPFVQNLKYSVNAEGNIITCVKWYLLDTNSTHIFEGWYNGMADSGVVTIRSTNDNINYEITTSQKSFAEYNAQIQNLSETMGLEVMGLLTLIPSEVVDIINENSIPYGELIKSENSYILTCDKATYIYEDNKLKFIDGVEIIINQETILSESDIPIQG